LASQDSQRCKIKLFAQMLQGRFGLASSFHGLSGFACFPGLVEFVLAMILSACGSS